MKPKDSADVEFAARLILKNMLPRPLVEEILKAQEQLIARGKPLTVAQICVRKKWLTRSEARYLIHSGDSAPADLVEGHTITGLLGVGGMSRVFAATDSSGREVALKVLDPALARDPGQKERFLREGALLQSFQHENIVSVHDVFESDGLHVIAMELVRGKSILELLDERGPFAEDAALYVILQIARALTHMYEHGVVHRDVKPGNVLIRNDNSVKLCDLGLATPLKVASDGEADDTTVGTVEYISPEQAMGLNNVDVRSDIYALGVTLYHMVVGDIPFKGEDDQETMAKRFVESLSSPKLSHVSPHMHYFIQKMMATDREIRYQSPGELIADIEDQIRGSKSLTGESESGDLDLERPFKTGSRGFVAPRPTRRRSPRGRNQRRRR